MFVSGPASSTPSAFQLRFRVPQAWELFFGGAVCTSIELRSCSNKSVHRRKYLRHTTRSSAPNTSVLCPTPSCTHKHGARKVSLLPEIHEGLMAYKPQSSNHCASACESKRLFRSCPSTPSTSSKPSRKCGCVNLASNGMRKWAHALLVFTLLIALQFPHLVRVSNLAFVYHPS